MAVPPSPPLAMARGKRGRPRTSHRNPTTPASAAKGSPAVQLPGTGLLIAGPQRPELEARDVEAAVCISPTPASASEDSSSEPPMADDHHSTTPAPHAGQAKEQNPLSQLAAVFRSGSDPPLTKGRAEPTTAVALPQHRPPHILPEPGQINPSDSFTGINPAVPSVSHPQSHSPHCSNPVAPPIPTVTPSAPPTQQQQAHCSPWSPATSLQHQSSTHPPRTFVPTNSTRSTAWACNRATQAVSQPFPHSSAHVSADTIGPSQPVTRATSPRNEPQLSFAQLLDPNEGTELQYIPSTTVNGTICTQIENADVIDEIQYWQSAVLCTVMGANPPFEVMKGYFKRIWANFDIDKIMYVRKGVFLVRFVHLQDKIVVEKRGCYFFDSKPMLVKGWNPSMDLQTETIRSLPLWIQLHGLDIKYWGTKSLSKIGSILGMPLKTDKYTKERQMIRYARLLIEMPIEGPFPDYIDFFNEAGILIRQPVSYEWIPTKCNHCAMLGHTEDVCKKKRVIRSEWRQVLKPQAPTPPNKDQSKEMHPYPATTPQPLGDQAPAAPQLSKDASSETEQSGEYTTVTRGRSPKSTYASPVSPLANLPNQFNVLIEDQNMDVSQEDMPNTTLHGTHRQLER